MESSAINIWHKYISSPKVNDRQTGSRMIQRRFQTCDFMPGKDQVGTNRLMERDLNHDEDYKGR